MKYRIRIEKLTDEDDMLIQSQAEIPIHNQYNLYQQLDIIELHYKQLLKQFREYEQNQPR